LEAYAKGLGEKKWAPIEAKLKEGESLHFVLAEKVLMNSTPEREEKGYDWMNAYHTECNPIVKLQALLHDLILSAHRDRTCSETNRYIH
jgi:hypothetical protein